MIFLADVVRWFLDPAHWHGPGGIPTRLTEHVEQLTGPRSL